METVGVGNAIQPSAEEAILSISLGRRWGMGFLVGGSIFMIGAKNGPSQAEIIHQPHFASESRESR
jgi:hypothetical protein